MRLKGLLILVFLFIGGVVNAQTYFKPGYVINLNNDTLRGELDYRGDLLMGNRCRFKEANTDKEIVYRPDELVGYRFFDGNYYISKDVKEERRFLEILVEGPMILYYYRDEKGDHYFFKKEDTKIIEIPYEESIKEKDGRKYQYKSKTHIGLFTHYMQETPELKTQIYDIVKPDHENLVGLVKDYNKLVCKSCEDNRYEKKLPPIKINIEFSAGMVSYKSLEYISSKAPMTAGIIAHVWLPRISEKIYLRTGLMISRVVSENKKIAIYKIPIQFEYLYPKGRIRPTFAYGINFYSPRYQTAAFMAGINLKLLKSLYLGIYYDIDFNPVDAFPLFPKSTLSQSGNAGLKFNF